MTIGTKRGLVIGISAVLALSACEDGQAPKFLQSQEEVTRASTSNGLTRTVERDVEAPEVFQVSDKGLWDGRPSLGGVWVAHPDAKNPERVIIRNTDSSKFVVGVLYKPERMQPGPSFQVSSDAAEALGMLAGQPGNLSVTALRSETVESAPEPGEGGETAATGGAATRTAAIAAPKVEARALDPIASAAAAIDRADETPATPASAPAGAPARREVATPASSIAAGIGSGAAAPAATPASASSLAKPYIQIGIFSVQQNANNTSESMRRAGMVPTIKPGKMNGKEFWRVIVGPAGTGNERAQLLKKIKELGFTDAYYVSR